MAFNKLFVAVLLASVAAVLSDSVDGRPNDLIVGARQPGDYILQREHVRVESIPLYRVDKELTFSGDNMGKITEMRLLDQNKKGNGATAVIKNGGPGNYFATVFFEAKRGHSIDFMVEIYGKRY